MRRERAIDAELNERLSATISEALLGLDADQDKLNQESLEVVAQIRDAVLRDFPQLAAFYGLKSEPDAIPDQWRSDRSKGWYCDPGYGVQDELHRHHYSYLNKGSKPDDPGWHRCHCGWEGYWSGYNSHVADELRAVLVQFAKGETPHLSD